MKYMILKFFFTKHKVVQTHQIGWVPEEIAATLEGNFVKMEPLNQEKKVILEVGETTQTRIAATVEKVK